MIILPENLTKPKRTEVYNMLHNALSKDKPLAKNDLQKLMMYFAPNTPKYPKEPWQWIAQIVDQKEFRPQIRHIYVKDGVMYGTNGHLLKYCKTDLENGFYNKLTLDKIDCDNQYPDCQRLIPEFQELRTFNTKNFEIKNSRNMFAYIIDNTCFQKKYIDQCADKNGNIQLAIKPQNDHTQSVYGKHEFGKFVVMPVKL